MKVVRVAEVPGLLQIALKRISGDFPSVFLHPSRPFRDGKPNFSLGL